MTLEVNVRCRTCKERVASSHHVAVSSPLSCHSDDEFCPNSRQGQATPPRKATPTVPKTIIFEPKGANQNTTEHLRVRKWYRVYSYRNLHWRESMPISDPFALQNSSAFLFPSQNTHERTNLSKLVFFFVLQLQQQQQ
jgi:hypothetical protein